jgi:MinD superfamily P-loop ATPase
MKIAIASGKGGTGKTTIATCLAHVAATPSRTVAYLDCDVEEPNGHIFLVPHLGPAKPVGVTTPRVDESACTHCGQCGEVCQFSAIVSTAKAVMVFPELCHGCGGCAMVCPTGAISEQLHRSGTVEVGAAGEIAFVRGTLDVGQMMSGPVIRAVKEASPDVDLMLIDAPAGTGCSVVQSVRDCDYLVLVTEPTPFGLNDLELAVDMGRALSRRLGVVINRSDIGDDCVEAFCQQEQIPILGRIPDNRRVAEAYSRGDLVCEAVPEWGRLFTAILKTVIEAAEVVA